MAGRTGFGRLLQAIGLLAAPSNAGVRAARAWRLADLQGQYDDHLQRWHAHDTRREWDTCLATLRSVHAEGRRLQEQENAALVAASWRAHLGHFLERHEIIGASIKGVGAGRKIALAGSGVETANDVEPALLRRVPGFGPVLVEAMLAWRAGIEAQYRRPALMPKLDPAEEARIRAALAKQLQPALDRLKNGPARLRQIAERELAETAAALQLLARLARQVAQAAADLNAG